MVDFLREFGSLISVLAVAMTTFALLPARRRRLAARAKREEESVEDERGAAWERLLKAAETAGASHAHQGRLIAESALKQVEVLLKRNDSLTRQIEETNSALNEMREHFARCERDTADLRTEIEKLKRAVASRDRKILELRAMITAPSREGG